MRIKFSDYILEQSISDAEVSDIALEQAKASVEVSMAVCEAYLKQMDVCVVMEDGEASNGTDKKGFIYKLKNFLASVYNFFKTIVIRMSGWISEKRINKILKKLESMSDEEKTSAEFYLPYEDLEETYRDCIYNMSNYLSDLKKITNESDIDDNIEIARDLYITRAFSKEKSEKKDMRRYNYDDYYKTIKDFRDAIIKKKSEYDKIVKEIKSDPMKQFKLTDEKAAKKVYKKAKKAYSAIYSAITACMTELITDIKCAEKIYKKDVKAGTVENTARGFGYGTRAARLVEFRESIIREIQDECRDEFNQAKELHETYLRKRDEIYGSNEKKDTNVYKLEKEAYDKLVDIFEGKTIPEITEIKMFSDRITVSKISGDFLDEYKSYKIIVKEQMKIMDIISSGKIKMPTNSSKKEPSTIGELIEFGIERSGETISVERVESIWKDYIDTLNHFGKQVQKINVKNEKFNDIAKKFGKLCESVKFDKNEEYKKFIDNLKNINRERDGYNVKFGTDETIIHNPVTETSLFIYDFIEFIGAFRAGARLSIYEKHPEKYRKKFDDNFKLVEQRISKNKQQSSEDTASEEQPKTVEKDTKDVQQIPEDRVRRLEKVLDEALKVTKLIGDRKYWVIFPELYDEYKKIYDEIIKQYEDMRGKLNTNEKREDNDEYMRLHDLEKIIKRSDKLRKIKQKTDTPKFYSPEYYSPEYNLILALQRALLGLIIYNRIPREIYITKYFMDTESGKHYNVATCTDAEFDLCIKYEESNCKEITDYRVDAEKHLKEQKDSVE